MDGSLFYDFAGTSLGFLGVAGSARGVCAVRFGADGPAVEACLRGEFPFARLERDRGRAGPWLRALVRFAEGASVRLDLPLDVRGSRFERRVWAALRSIPYGATRSYGEVARAIGRPGAARAVARACAANPALLAVPCHRVVPAAGGSGGYAAGSDRKRLLLDREARAGARVRRAAVDRPTGAPGYLPAP